MEPNQFKTPPKWLDKLLNWFVAPHLREEVLGDIHERYALRVKRMGERKARRTYWREVLAYVRPRFLKRQPSKYAQPANTDMLQNYVKIALRNLVRNKAYSAINIGGLAVGMATANYRSTNPSSSMTVLHRSCRIRPSTEARPQPMLFPCR